MKRLLIFGAAALCFWAALALIAHVGLPQRSLVSRLTLDSTLMAPEIGATSPLFSTTLLDGSEIDLFRLRGTPVILNFWATWCIPCEVEMEELEQLYRARAEKGLQIVAINIGEARAPIADWVARLQLSFDIALDSDTRISQRYQLRGQPMTFVIDPQGIIRQIYFGATQRATLEAALAPYLP